MNKLFATILLLLSLSINLFAQKIITLAPIVDEQSQDYVQIQRVELTNAFTIIHFRYKQQMSLRDLFNRRAGQASEQTIQIDPNSRIYESNNVNKKFLFIKAEGIPVKPDKRYVEAGTIVNFKVYYKRLDPGIEVFDFYEGKDRPDDRLEHWNYYGVHIRNPKKTPPKTPIETKQELKKLPLVVPKIDSTVANKEEKTTTTFPNVKGNVAVGDAIRLDNIYFAVSKYELLPASFVQLDYLVNWLKENPTAEIRVEGHTDSVGDFDENVKLSFNRAEAVKKYLIGKGIETIRIETKGLGPTQPVSKGTSDTERQKNRRVEFVILKL